MPNPFSPLTGLINFLRSFGDISAAKEPDVAAKAAVIDAFEQTARDPEKLNLLLQLAEAKYSERVAEFETLVRKGEWLIAFTMGLLTLLIGAERLAPVQTLGWRIVLGISLAFLILALLVLLASRSVRSLPARFSIQQLREALLDDRIILQDWIAGSLQKTSNEIRMHQEVVAAHLNVALACVFVGLVMAAILAIFSS